jgi:hypothetical protein
VHRFACLTDAAEPEPPGSPSQIESHFRGMMFNAWNKYRSGQYAGAASIAEAVLSEIEQVQCIPVFVKLCLYRVMRLASKHATPPQSQNCSTHITASFVTWVVERRPGGGGLRPVGSVAST